MQRKKSGIIKQVLSVFLAIVMAVNILPVTAYAGSMPETVAETLEEVQEESTQEESSETASQEESSEVQTSEQETETTKETEQNRETEEMSSTAEEEESKTDESMVETQENEAEEIVTEEETKEVLLMPALDGVGEVTRVRWLHELTTVFNMTVEEDNYPDNYYSDIDSSSAYYYDVMLATEFGLIDVEAGEAMMPDEAATKEFAAHTLNLCLGYHLEEGSNYTFNESGEVTYPEDIQIAVNHGWFALTNGAFLPDNAITAAEQAVMLEEAKTVVASEAIDTNYNNQYTFLSDVIVVPEGTPAELTGENEITITDCPVTLAVGNKFAMVEDGFPVVYRAAGVTVTGDKTIVVTELVATEEAFESIAIQGSIAADLGDTQTTNSEVALSYIVGGSEEEEWEDGTKYTTLEQVGGQKISAIEAQQSFDIPDRIKKQYDLGDGVKATISCKVSNPYVNYKATGLTSAYFDAGATVTFSCNVSMDVLDALGVSDTITLVYIPIGCFAHISATLNLTLEGNVTVSLVERVSAGVDYHKGSGFRMVTHFYKESFTIQAHAEASAGLTVEAALGWNFIKGSIYGKVGAVAVMDSETYTDGNKPTNCTHVFAYMYAYIGCFVSVDLGVHKDSWGEEYVIYSRRNSPVRVSYHYEDGMPVARCTRENAGGSGTSRWKYYTPADSKYGYNGASSGIGSNGEEYTIFDYSLDEDGNATITKYNGNVSALSIPETLDGHTVVGIGDWVFENKTQLRVVVIPDSVATIGSAAFRGCKNLTSLSLSKKLVSTGSCVFQDCEALTEVEIPKSLQSTGGCVFEGCTSLKNVTFEKGVTEIANGLFSYCLGIEKMEIPDTVTIIEDGAFQNCEKLSSVSIPDSVTEIRSYTFSGCTTLVEVIIPNSVTSMGDYIFSGCKNLLKVILPDNTETIMSGTFQNCTSLASAEIPKSVVDICGNAFQNCKALQKVTFGENLETIEVSAFNNCTELSEITFGNNIKTIGNNAFQNCDALTKVELPDSLTTMGTYAFAECDSLSDVKLSTGLTNIPSYAFNLCPALRKIVLPYRIASVSSNAFTNCTALTEITIPRATTSIGSNAFSYPTKMTIYGVGGTYAETYAEEVGAKFVNQEIKATAVSFNTEELNLNRGSAANLILTVIPENFTDEVAWRCTDTEIATVSDAGVVTGKKVGTATVKVTVGETSASCKINVLQPVTSIRLNAATLSIEALETYQLTASVYPADAANKEVEWSSSDEKVAIVNETGRVTAVAKGEAVITAKAKDGSGIYRGCTVTVTGNGYLCSSVEELESPHNYAVNCSDSWLYTEKGAEELYVTFDEKTDMEEDFDFLYIYDGQGNLIGKYTGKQLAGKTIHIPGDSIRIKLVSDEAGTAWGFKVTSISATGTAGEEPEDEENVLPEDIPESGIPEGLWIAGVKDYTYTGKAIKPEVRVYDGSRRLKAGRDYSVSYKNNTKANNASDAQKAPTVVVKGKGNYTGTETAVFKILPIDLNDSSIETQDIVVAYNKKQQKKVPVVSYNGKKLANKKDFTVSYPALEQGMEGAFQAPGTYEMVLTAKENGNYTGARVVNLIITEKTLLTQAVIKKIPNQTYQNGMEIQPKLVVTYKKAPLEEGIDYTVSYMDNTEIGTATAVITGIGEYAGTKKVKFKITGEAIKKAVITGIENKVYNGTAQRQESKVTLAGKTLTEGEDYTVSYSNNKDAGTASVLIKGIHGYTGSVKKTFKITAYDLQEDSLKLLKDLSGELSVKYVKGGCKPEIRLSFDGTALAEGMDYKLSYKNNKAVTEKAIMTIKGKGNFKGTLTKEFRIIAKELSDMESKVTVTLADVGFVNKAGKYISKPILTDADGKKLTAGKDYEKEIRYSLEDGTVLSKTDIVNADTVVCVTITGKGAYTGTLETTYRVAKESFSKAKIRIEPQVYTGEEVYLDKEDIQVTIGGKVLSYGTDYEIVQESYQNNIKKGNAVVTVIGKGNYGGMKNVKFRITAKQLQWLYK